MPVTPTGWATPAEVNVINTCASSVAASSWLGPAGERSKSCFPGSGFWFPDRNSGGGFTQR